jgi:hypothetical protein
LDTELPAECLVLLVITVDCCYLGKTGEVLSCLFVCGLEILAVATPRGVEFDDLEGLDGAGRCMDWTYRSVIRLGDQTIIILAIDLNNGRALRIETRIDRQSCQKSCCCNGDSSGVDHVGGLTTVEAVAARRGINA